MLQPHAGCLPLLRPRRRPSSTLRPPNRGPVVAATTEAEAPAATAADRGHRQSDQSDSHRHTAIAFYRFFSLACASEKRRGRDCAAASAAASDGCSDGQRRGCVGDVVGGGCGGDGYDSATAAAARETRQKRCSRQMCEWMGRECVATAVAATATTVAPVAWLQQRLQRRQRRRRHKDRASVWQAKLTAAGHRLTMTGRRRRR